MRFTLTDSRNDTWFDASLRNGIVTMRMRSKDGKFAPLKGDPRPIPQTLTMKMDATVKVKIFTVGVKQLVGTWTNIGTAQERGWDMHFTKEPVWQLPGVVKHLIKTPLRRPFTGDGTRFRIVFRQVNNGQNTLARQGHTTVQESGILRFLGKLGGDAMGDFVAEAEAEENKFNAAVFKAMKADFSTIWNTR